MVLEMEKTGGRLSGEPASFVWTTHLTDFEPVGVEERLRHATMPVPWCPTFNWAPDQLGTRGSLDPVAQEQRVLLIGAGALGSLFAENWVRAGGVPQRSIANYQHSQLNISNGAFP